jgi:hypothetical protein
MTSLLVSTTQNPQSIFFTMWNASSNVTRPSLFALFVLIGHVQLHQLSFHESIITFLDKLCQPHVDDAWSIIFFLLEIFNLLHSIWTNAPIFQIQNVKKKI